MRRTALFLAAAVVVASSLAAHADTFSTFSLTDVTFTNLPSWSVTGTVTIDTTIGGPFGSDIQISTPGGIIAFSGIGWSDDGPPSAIHIFGGEDYNYLLTLVLPTAPVSFSNGEDSGGFFGYSGGPLCTDSNPCQGPEGISLLSSADTNYDLQTGSLVMDVPSAATPEPSTLALLGTGLLGAAGAIRRKLFNA